MSVAELRGSRGVMTPLSAGLLYLERPHAPLTIAVLAFLSGPISRAALVCELESRIPRLRRLSQRPVPFPFDLSYPSWEDAPDFRVEDHVFRWGLPAANGVDALLEVAAQLVPRPLPPERPLWEVHVLDGLPGERSAVLLKVHHCLLEGIAGTRMLELLLGRDAEPRVARTPGAPLRPPDGTAARLYRALRERHRRRMRWLRAAAQPVQIRRPIGEVREALRGTLESARKLAPDEIPELPWNAPIGPRRRLGLLRFELEAVSKLRRAESATLNDALLAIAAGGLQRYLAQRGATSVLEVMALVPVSLPTVEVAGSAGGHLSALRVRLPVRSGDDVARLRATRAVLDRLKADRAWSGVSGLLRVAEQLPPPVFGWLARRVRIGRIANLIASNVPGPEEPRYLCGRRVEAVYPLMPIVDNVGLSLAAYSYAGSLHLGLNADADLVPDLHVLIEAMEEAFQAMS
jgi:WS/DGAT/MGAT family acyltransferase